MCIQRKCAGYGEVVAGSTLAAHLHEIGDYRPQRCNFITPIPLTVKEVGLDSRRFRLRHEVIPPEDITYIQSIPVLSYEATLVDLALHYPDPSLLADALDYIIYDRIITDFRPLIKRLGAAASLHMFPEGDGKALFDFLCADIIQQHGVENELIIA